MPILIVHRRSSQCRREVAPPLFWLILPMIHRAKTDGRHSLSIVFLVLFLVPFIPAHFKSTPASPPFTIHPENSKYFLFRGKPVVLITATEHYGSVINSRFNFERYLEEAADKRMTLTRLFLLFRELQSAQPQLALETECPTLFHLI